MTAHALVTAVVEFATQRAERVQTCLESFRNPAADDIARRLDGTGLIHFLTISTVELSAERSAILIELSVDGDGDTALDALAAALPDELQQLFRTAGIALPTGVRGRLRTCKIQVGQGFLSTCGLDFDGTPAMSIDRIRREKYLAEWIEQRRNLLQGPLPPHEKLTHIRNSVWQEGSLKWAFVPQPCPILAPRPPTASLPAKARIVLTSAFAFLIWPWPILPVLFAAITALLHQSSLFHRLLWSFLVSIALLVLAAAALAYALRHLEKADPAADAVPDRVVLEAVLSTENIVSQNILVTTSIMKPARLRLLFLRGAFLFIGRLLPLTFTPGQLGNISDIHFARWVLLPGSNVLVFRSNYDGSWLSYLLDFVQRAPAGVTAIWSNTIGFPRASWLFRDGATDGPRFLQWARTQTKPAPFWYTAYPTLSMSRIRLNAQIARAIGTGEIDPEIVGWLKSLGATTARHVS